MSTFLLALDVNASDVGPSMLEIWVAGVLVDTLSLTQGNNLTELELEFTGSFPTSLDFVFSAGSGTIDFNSVRIGGQELVGSSYFTTLTLNLSETADVNTTANVDYVFGRTDPVPATDFGPATITGTTGDDNPLKGTIADDIIDGLAGNDRIFAGAGDDKIDGGDGDDRIWAEDGNDVVIGGQGADVIFGGAGDDLLFGQAGNDVIIGGDGNDTINGGANDDSLIGGAGDDVLYGEGGNDLLVGDGGVNFLYGDGGNDTLIGGVDVDTIYGGIGNDFLWGDTGADFLYGEGGDDFIFGWDGDDVIDGASGDDFIMGDAGADIIDGGLGADTIYGGAGNDTLTGGAGIDLIYGDGGIDTVVYTNAEGPVTASLLAGTASDDGDDASDTLTDIENITGSAFGDNLTGDTGVNVLIGNAGDDTLTGGGGDDTLDGGTGNDTLFGDAGADTLSGGIGNDTLNGGADNDTLYALDNGVSASNADDGSTNTLNGGLGNDTLNGSTGTDTLNGGDGADTLISNSVASIVTLLSSNFDTGIEDFTYSDGGFGGGDPGNDIDGTRNTSDGGMANGSLEVFADGAVSGNSSGSWDSSITVGASDLINAQITFSYRHWHAAGNDSGEDSHVYFEFDGTIYDAAGGNSFISEALGSAGETDTLWQTVTIDLPNLTAGATYNLSMGILHSGSSGNNEDAYVRFDDITITGTDSSIYTTLNGQDGLDTLTGSDGGYDVFLFENASMFNNIDVINNFNTADGDTIDLFLALNTFYIEAVHTITDFIRITDDGTDSTLEIDLDGTLGVYGWATVATLAGVTGLTDEAALNAAGNLIMPVVSLDIIGTPAPDILIGTGAGETIGGLASDDTLSGRGGVDTLYGGLGNDTADYSAAAVGPVTADLSTGVASNDGDGANDIFDSIENITGSAFGDSLTGDDKDNVLKGLAGIDTLVGGDGNDTLAGGAGNDSLDGGLGNDTADYTDAGGGVIASISGGATNDGDGGGTDTFTSIENIIGSAFGDTLTGDGGPNVLTGLAGNDTLTGLAGNDTLYGGDDDDTLIGGTGFDILDGGGDTDTVDYTNAANAVTASLTLGTASDDGDGASDTLIFIENITGTAFDDDLTGDDNPNILKGLAGDDLFTSGGGADTYDGGADTDTVDYSNAAADVTASLLAGTAIIDGDGSNDVLTAIENLTGSAFDDTLTGDGNVNILIGGIGSDTLSGGGGNDTLYAAVIGVTLLSASFDANAEGFLYSDGGFGGTDPGGDNASGVYNATDGNTANGSLEVFLDGAANGSETNISGSWDETFNVVSDTANVQLTFAYRLWHAAENDAGEDVQLYVDLDGTIYDSSGGNSFIVEALGSDGLTDTGWVTVTIDLPDLTAGDHDISIGILKNLKTSANEDSWVRLDDIVIQDTDEDGAYTNILNGDGGDDTLYGSAGASILNGGDGADTLYSGSVPTVIALISNSFNADEQDFTYSDGGFGGTDPATFVSGAYDGTDGATANGSIQVAVDSTNDGFTNASGSYDASITLGLSNLSDVQITFSYRHFHAAGNDTGEDSQVYFEFDGTIYDDLGGNSFISEALGTNGEVDTGWITVTIDLPNLTASSTYNLSMGIVHTSSNQLQEDAYVKFDDITLSGVDEVPVTTLNGQDGLDDLYGSSGTDIFMFEAASAFNDIDLINNFDASNRDAFNIADLLTGYTGAEDITEWVQITDDGTDSTLSIDADGLAGGSTYLAIATVVGVIGLTDEGALEAAGSLITL